MKQKEIWLEAAKQIIQDRIKNAEKAIARAKEATHSEDKSSAGDKYETARAMSQLESEMNAKQLKQAEIELSNLDRINLEPKNTAVTGALIVCQDATYFMSIGLGKIEREGSSCILISPNSPIGKEFLGKKPGDQILWNQQTLTISEIL